MDASFLLFTLIPVATAIVGAAIAVRVQPGQTVVSAIQHLAAGVVFAAAAAEILPGVIHSGSIAATLIGGAAGVIVMLVVKHFGAKAVGPVGLLAVVGIDIAIDGLVLGIGFAAGERTGVLLAIALSIEILFLGVTVANELNETASSKLRVVAVTGALVLLLPIAAAISTPVAAFPPSVVVGFLSFGLMALLYLVTEELLVEAHELPDRPWVPPCSSLAFSSSSGWKKRSPLQSRPRSRGGTSYAKRRARASDTCRDRRAPRSSGIGRRGRGGSPRP